MSSFGLIIIGNEILNGQVKDENTLFVAKSLPVLGLKLKQISVIPDDIDMISKEVSKFSREYDYVITSGGIGTTHDDVTFEGVASAFNESVYQHKELSTQLIKFFNLTEEDVKNSPKLKLARVPESAKLIYGTHPETGVKMPYPVVATYNVYILPGIPSLFIQGFNIIKNIFPQCNSKLHTKSLYFSIEESKLTLALNQVVQEFSDSIIFGSYPVSNNFYKVKITMESCDEDKIELAANKLTQSIGRDNVSKYDPCVFTEASEKVYKLAGQARIKSALDAIQDTFKTYQPHEVVVAFTGGKDCTVLLHLIHAYLQRYQPDSPMIRVLFIRSRPSFKEVEDFIKQTLTNYKIIPPRSSFLEYNGMIKTSLFRLQKDHPEIKAIFMGTKKHDPNGNQTIISKTTDGWPEYALINPVLDWSYSEIWDFLLTLSVPYCSLYDRGYTSLGGMDCTLPNPNLLHSDVNGRPVYYPAYYLEKEDDERVGRQTSNVVVNHKN